MRCINASYKTIYLAQGYHIYDVYPTTHTIDYPPNPPSSYTKPNTNSLHSVAKEYEEVRVPRVDWREVADEGLSLKEISEQTGLESASMPPRQKAEAREWLGKWTKIFSRNPKAPEKSFLPPHEIHFHPGPDKRAKINAHVDEMLAGGICEPSRSPYASPVVIAFKKGDEKGRFCVD